MSTPSNRGRNLGSIRAGQESYSVRLDNGTLSFRPHYGRNNSIVAIGLLDVLQWLTRRDAVIDGKRFRVSLGENEIRLHPADQPSRPFRLPLSKVLDVARKQTLLDL